MRRFAVFASVAAATCLFGCATVPSSPASPKIHVEYRQLINSDAKEIAGLISEFNNVSADADSNTNTLIVKGPPEQVATAIDMTNHLEMAGPDVSVDVLFIRRLKNAKAADLAAELEQMSERGFFGSDVTSPRSLASSRPQFVVDARTNAVIVYASRFDEERIRGVIDELDRPWPPPATQPQPDLRLDQGKLAPRQPE